ncbi:hypothetical protein QUF72_07070 [Desulfobacterales bacterium HSG2]|nr:hypothetical protein [Desulfobacterales bacterium HSG2]
MKVEKIFKTIYIAILTAWGIVFILLADGNFVVNATPVINDISEAQTLYGKDTSAKLWANVTPESDEAGIIGVHAEIYSPEPSEPDVIVELQDADDDGIYEGVYDGFTIEDEDTYDILIVASDNQGDTSDETTVTVIRSNDSYEEDDTMEQANIIVLNNENLQWHNFYKTGDEDWLKFYGLAGETYAVIAANPGPECDIVIELYEANSTTPLENSAEGEYALVKDGIHYVRLFNNDPDEYGELTGYEIEVILKYAPEAVPFTGTVRNAFSRMPIGDVMLRTSQKYSALSEEDDGNYTMYHDTLTDTPSYSVDSDPVTLTARFPMYEIFQRLVFMTIAGFKVLPEPNGKKTAKTGRDTTVDKTDLIEWDGIIELIPKGDINKDRKIDLTDVLIALQTTAGMDTQAQIRSDYAESDADVNGDAKVGTEEVIHILKYLAERMSK